MAPPESAAVGIGPSRPRAVDTLMRALLYIVQQLGRPVSEAELRGVAALPEGPLDPASFLLSARRLGFDCHAVDLGRIALHDLPMPFALVSAAGRAVVVVSVKNEEATVLDVV